MPDIQRGESFTDGEQVTGARLNNHVTGAVITETFISGKTSTAPAVADWIVYWKAGVLRKTQLTNVVGLGGAGTVTSVGLTMPTDTFSAVIGSPVTGTGTLEVSHKSQATGEVLMGPAGAAGVPAWRRIEARDTWKLAVNVASNSIDWNLGDVFYKILSTGINFGWSNNESGRTIDVIIGTSGTYGVVWPTAVKWEGGTAPVMTVGTVGTPKWDWYRFSQYGANVLGVRLAANMS